MSHPFQRYCQLPTAISSKFMESSRFHSRIGRQGTEGPQLVESEMAFVYGMDADMQAPASSQ